MRVEAAKRTAAEAKVPPRWVQVSTWPDADGVRGLRWIDANNPQPPEWCEPQQLGPLPPRRRLQRFSGRLALGRGTEGIASGPHKGQAQGQDHVRDRR